MAYLPAGRTLDPFPVDYVVFDRPLSPTEIYPLWENYQRVLWNSLNYLERLIYCLQLTWLILIGKNKWRYQ